MHRHQLALQVSRQFTDLDPRRGADRFQFVAVTLTFGGTCEVDELRPQGRQLDAFVTLGGRPLGDVGQGIERGLGRHELREENRRAAQAGRDF
ncbi:hypothetical protein D3C86_1972800 [compost metagenome]